MSAPFAPVLDAPAVRWATSQLTAVSLCTGYGGLDSVLALVLGARTTHTADNDPDVSKLLDVRFDVPNLGDIQRVDWTTIERPDIVCAGFPCQDISPAGKRAGIKPGTRSGLWTWIAYVIGVLQPTYVFIENSRGLTSAKAHSDVEQCPFCMGDGSKNPSLRALGRVSGDLADLGYDSEWTCVRASDVGAPHERHRAFIWAWRRGETPDPRCAVGQAWLGLDSAEPGASSGRRSSIASSDAERRGRGAAADPRCGCVRGPARDETCSSSSSSSELSAGVGDGGQRVRADDRDARAGSVADADDSTGAEQDGHQATGVEASRRDDARRHGGTAADARRVCGISGRESAAVEAAGDGASSEPRRRDRARGDAADPALDGRLARGAERAGLVGRPDAERARCAASDAVSARSSRPRGLAEQAGVARSELDCADAADAVGDELARERDEQPRRATVAGARCSTADVGGARLEVGRVEPAGHERATAQRDRRDRLARLEPWVAAANTHVERRASWQRVAVRGTLGRTAARWFDSGDAPAGFVWVVPNADGDDIDYSQAIHTWEAITGRAAPLPAVPNRRGDYRLNPRFSEWMMGLPDGWVTAIPDISRTAQLRIIGNGLVPAQGVLALLQLLEASRDF